jgi:hypothetical protein
MIDNALQTLALQLDEYLKRMSAGSQPNHPMAEACFLVSDEGKIQITDETLGVILVNIEEERIHKTQSASMPTQNGRIAKLNPEIKLNLFVLLVANCKVYKTALQLLSGAIACFQSKNVFIRQNTPQLHDRIEKLVVEMQNLNFEQQNHLWGTLGGKYLPSVMYRVRMITFQTREASEEVEPIRTIVHREDDM